MPSRVLNRAGVVFDSFERRWESLATQRRVATVLVLVFVVGLLLVEGQRRGWLPNWLGEYVSSNHFDAILPPFSLLLLTEVISLVFALAQSVARAAGKQLEIMSLILIRQSFKELTFFEEPVVWDQMAGDIGHRVFFILSDAVGALLIFALLGVYFRLQKHQPITRNTDEQLSFVAAKKFIALALLASLVVIGIDATWSSIASHALPSFFEVFYTLLIFADVLIVLISLRYSTAYPVVFRYFGFAVATVLVRLALTAPRVVDAALGVTATLFAIGLTWVYNKTETGEHENPG